MKLLAWPADASGCREYRIDVPFRALAMRGHQVTIAPEITSEQRAGADVIVGQRVCLPLASRWWQRWAREGTSKLVFEIDDDLLHVDPSNTAAYSFFADGIIRANLVRNMQVADLVTVTTERLAEEVSQYNRNVAILPNCIKADLLDVTPNRSDNTVTIGWGGSATHQVDWEHADRQIGSFVNRRRDVDMHIFGGWMPPGLESRITPSRLRLTDWIHSVDALHRAMDFDIGVIPLKNMPFNLAKSDLKLLELAALGIPAVASNVGPYALSVQDGETGLLVRKPADWAAHLRALVEDQALRESIGKAAKDWAAEHRTIERNVALWEKAYA